jgi:hypothetical protein
MRSGGDPSDSSSRRNNDSAVERSSGGADWLVVDEAIRRVSHDLDVIVYRVSEYDLRLGPVRSEDDVLRPTGNPGTLRLNSKDWSPGSLCQGALKPILKVASSPCFDAGRGH